MATQRIVAEHVVSVTEMRKRPTEFFTDHPVAVLNKNQAAGYMVGKELFESMVDLIRQLQPQETRVAQFQPSASQLKAITTASAQFLASAREKELEDFAE